MPADWNKIRLEYITDGTTSYRKLAAKYGVSLRQISGRGKREDWPAQREQAADRAAAEFERVIVTESIGAAKAIAAAREVLATRALAVASHTADPDGLHKLASTLQILSKMMGLQPDLDEKEQKARIASIEARAGTQDATEGTGTIMLPLKEWEDTDE